MKSAEIAQTTAMLPRLSDTLAEIQGLYGAFSFPEKLLQKLWLRGDFNRAAALTTDGRSVRVVHPGKWNLLGGPDFRAARIGLGDEPDFMADIEVHLRAADWDAHGHARDPAYNKVALHVVLFPPEPGQMTRGVGGREIPILALLPLLHHDLEEFAADEAVESLANRPAAWITGELTQLTPDELTTTLRRHAEMRWRQKVRFARLRVQRLGWRAACHHVALEVLGYRFNRSPMLRIAGRWPLHQWVKDCETADEAYLTEAVGWSLQGVRPANHPRVRLQQYAAWIRARPDWPTALSALVAKMPDPAALGDTRPTRRAQGFAAWRERIAGEICGHAISGTRLDNFICDGLLPLVATQTSRELGGLWMHWFAGDLPPFLTDGLRQLGVFDGRSQPACHGLAQGLLGWLLEREARVASG